MEIIEQLSNLWKKCNQDNIVRLEKLEKFYGVSGKIYAKVENENLTGSIKDRTALMMVMDAYKDGLIKKDTILIEPTSGNTGISLAYIAKSIGIKAIIVMPSSMSEGRRKMIIDSGGELLLVDGGMSECVNKVNELLKDDSRYLCLSQFENLSNPKAHYLSTGPAIFKKLPNVNYVVAGIGTGGTISGLGKFLKENITAIKIVGVEPFESPLLNKGLAGSHQIQGIGANFIPKTLSKDVIDEVIDVKSQDAIETYKNIYNIGNINVGISSGAALVGALEVLKKDPGKTVVVIFPDNGDRYE